MKRYSPFAAIVALIVVLFPVVMACGPSAQPTATPKPPSATATAVSATPTRATAQPTATPAGPQPKYGGVVRGIIGGTPSTLDVQTYPAGDSAFFMMPMMNWLVQNYTAGNGVGPDLAQSWTISPDGQTFTFKLAPNVKWHDGTPLKAQDIVWNLNRIAFDKTAMPAAFSRANLATVKSVEAVDDGTVKITTTKSSGGLIDNLGAPGLVMLPPQVATADLIAYKQIMGSGPYKFKAWAPDNKLTLVKNEAYFKKDSAGRALPYLDGVELYVIPEGSAQLAAIRTGQVDVGNQDALYLPSQIDPVAKAVPGLGTRKLLPGYMRIVFNNRAPWDDFRLRYAVHLALDRVKIDKLSNEGLGEPYGLWNYATSKWRVPQATVATWPGYRTPKDADIAEAKRLFKEAGIDLETFKPPFPVSSRYENRVVPIVNDLKEGLGLKLDLQLIDNAVFSQLQSKREFGVAMDPYGPPLDEPYAAIAPFFLTGSPRNIAGWTDPKVDQALLDLDAELDAQKRLQKANAIEKMLVMEKAWIVPVGHYYRIMVWRPEVKNFLGSAFGQDGVGKRFEQVWLEK